MLLKCKFLATIDINPRLSNLFRSDSRGNEFSAVQRRGISLYISHFPCFQGFSNTTILEIWTELLSAR